MSQEKLIILPEDERAATYRTDICGWVSRGGRFFGEQGEEPARWEGSTHHKCSYCDEIIPKTPYSACPSCRPSRLSRRHAERERRAWDGESPIYSESEDEFFYDFEEVEEFCFEHECAADDLLLLLCEPISLPEIEPDLFDLPEDVELPAEIQAKVDELNAMLRSCAPLAWEPIGYAVELEEL